MTKHFTAWDQDTLRKAMAATVLPHQRPQKAIKPRHGSFRKDSMATRVYDEMQPDRWYRSRDFAAKFNCDVQTIADAFRNLCNQGRAEHWRSGSVVKYRKVL